MGDQLEPFKVNGKKDKLELVKANCVMEAIASGRDVIISYAEIQGELDASEYFEKNGIRDRVVKGRLLIKNSHIGRTDFNSFTFALNVSFQGTNFQTFSWFTGCTFSEEALFGKTVFKKGAEFLRTTFDGAAIFCETEFCGPVTTNFNDVVFNGIPYFSKALFKTNAQFSGTKFEREPHLHEAIFCHTQPNCFYVIGEAYRRSFLPNSASFFKRAGEGYEEKGCKYKEVGKDSEALDCFRKASDSFRNAKLEYEKEGEYDKAGEMYVSEMETKRLSLKAQGGSLLKRLILWFLKWNCNYGESPKRFIIVLPAIVLVFAIIYMPIIPNWCSRCPSITFKEYPFHDWGAGIVDGFLFNIGTAIYFSVVTFATLGFGDIAPVSLVGKFWASFEVLSGYLMLGVLITLVARKITRS